MRLAFRHGLVIALAAAAGTAAAAELEVHGVAAARGLVVEGQRSWLEGGFGRLTEGAGEPNDALPAVRGQLHLGLDWKPGAVWLVRASGVVQGEPDSSLGRRGGVVEAFAQVQPDLTDRTLLRLRAGVFFPQTSLENVDRLWQSPYTITLSAWNTWIGEEARTIGLESAWTLQGARDRLEIAAAVSGANDASGALLAWRGFAWGDRLTTVGEVLPLPPLPTLRAGGDFASQRDDGTRPVDELDGRPGWQARARYAREGRFRLQAAYTDNRGDRALHRGQYAWRTRFGQAGLEAQLGPDVTLVAEAAVGETGMGLPPPAPRVDLRFRAGYALLSWSRGPVRVSGRVEAFDNDDRDGVAEPDQEDGWALTGALLWQPARIVRVGAEYLVVRARRPAAAFSGADPDTDARRALLEVRLAF
jgi:hypothetical protein